ncbi:MAG: lysophospholipid acyltransferase family protein [SAR324 cluster bacterium]|nr:lysophospholipid acyltransferase family protein [SAR324 cluster bacterium]
MQDQEEISYQAFKKKRPQWTKTVRRNLEYRALQGGVALGRRLSLEKLQFWGRCLGKVAHSLLKKDRGIIEQQLALVFPDVPIEQRQLWTYECFLHFGQMLFEVLGMNHMAKESASRFEIYGEELLDEGHHLGKGTIVLGAHLGNWEMLSSYISKTGYSTKVAVTPLYDERLNDFFVKMREKEGVTLIQRNNPRATRSILECFKQNEIFFVLIDQDTDVSSMFVPFFGMLAQTPVGASSLALKTGALVISAMVIRQPRGKFEIRFERLGVFGKKNYSRADLFEVTAQFNQHLEQIIKRYPSQWAWFHRRWKHQPEEKDILFFKEMMEFQRKTKKG